MHLDRHLKQSSIDPITAKVKWILHDGYRNTAASWCNARMRWSMTFESRCDSLWEVIRIVPYGWKNYHLDCDVLPAAHRLSNGLKGHIVRSLLLPRGVTWRLVELQGSGCINYRSTVQWYDKYPLQHLTLCHVYSINTSFRPTIQIESILKHGYRKFLGQYSVLYTYSTIVCTKPCHVCTSCFVSLSTE